MDDAKGEALLTRLQAQAEGPRHACEIRERSLGQALLAGLL
ncbi:hypothetical protein [Phytopseudomonas flavescens]|nr:hypothetical protein [Pseudomonas flavescens]